MLEQLSKIQPELIEIRRHFHMNPELSFQEEKTPAYIADYLEKLGGVEVRRNVGGRGVVASIKGKGSGKTVALRADFDALELQDEKDVPYKSKTPGVMHACGHDSHAAALLGVANILSKNKDSFSGEVRFLFQHAEELAPGGALSMIKDGCLDGVDAVFGIHVTTRMPVGKYGYRSGYMMASADKFTINIFGKGGHGASPHETVDSIVVGSNVVMNLQQIVSRRTIPTAAAVVSIGRFESGSAFNVISDSAMLGGTVRTYDKNVRKNIIENMERIVKGCCEAAGATYKLNYEQGYPAVKNHPNETALVAKTLLTFSNNEDVIELEPIMGGEDFAYYLEKVPGAFFYTGGGNADNSKNYPHHHPKFDIDEGAILYASKGLLSVAIEYLK